MEGLAGRGGAWEDEGGEAIVEEMCGFAAEVVAPGEEVIAAKRSLVSKSFQCHGSEVEKPIREASPGHLLVPPARSHGFGGDCEAISPAGLGLPNLV